MISFERGFHLNLPKTLWIDRPGPLIMLGLIIHSCSGRKWSTIHVRYVAYAGLDVHKYTIAVAVAMSGRMILSDAAKWPTADRPATVDRSVLSSLLLEADRQTETPKPS